MYNYNVHVIGGTPINNVRNEMIILFTKRYVLRMNIIFSQM